MNLNLPSATVFQRWMSIGPPALPQRDSFFELNRPPTVLFSRVESCDYRAGWGPSYAAEIPRAFSKGSSTVAGWREFARARISGGGWRPGLLHEREWSQDD